MHRKSISLLLLCVVLAATVAVAFATTPTPTPAPSPTVSACEGAPQPRLKVGDVARPAQVYNSLRDTLGSTKVVTLIRRANNDTYTVVAGPFCGYGPYTWYQVDFKGTLGYITEGTGEAYWTELVQSPNNAPLATSSATARASSTPSTISPTASNTASAQATPAALTLSPSGCPDAPTPRLKANDSLRPLFSFSTLWQNPNSSTVLTTIQRDTTATVLSGPYCNGSAYNWYEVRFGAQVGYITEGTDDTYYVEPVVAGTATPSATPNSTPTPSAEATQAS